MPKQRNTNSHRTTEANKERTRERVEEYLTVQALRMTWEEQSDDVQVREHDRILRLRKRERNLKNYLSHRADAGAEV